MFGCGKIQRRCKRKSTRWQAGQCFSGNKSIDASTLELTFDPNVVSPLKRRRLAPVDGSIESQEDRDVTGSELFHLEDDKENTLLHSYHGYRPSTESKNNLFLWESTLVHHQTVSCLHSDYEVSTINQQPNITNNSLPETPAICASDQPCDGTPSSAHQRLPFCEVQNSSLSALLPEHPSNSNLTSEVDGDMMTDTRHLVSPDSESMSTNPKSTRRGRSNPASKGALRLTITVKGSAQIIIHAHEALDLVADCEHKSYVETMLVPDRNENSAQQSQIQSSINPKYDEKITYDIRSSEQCKRLMVSVMEEQDDKSCSKVVGCMSFGIKHLLSKGKKTEVPVDGWYHVLSKNLGASKHLACSPSDVVARQQRQTGQDRNASPQKSTVQKGLDSRIAKKLHGTRKHTVVISKSSMGYGFTIKGTMPVRVGRVKPDGAAEAGGLRNADYILSINDQDTTSSTVELVANIVRNSPHRLEMEIARPIRSKEVRSSGCLPKPIRTEQKSQPECSTVRSQQESVTSEQSINEEMSGNISAAERISSWGVQLSQQILGEPVEFPWQPELSVIREEKSMEIISNRTKMSAVTNSPWQPDLSVITPDSTRYLPLRLNNRSYGLSSRSSDQTYEEINTVRRSRPCSWYSLTPETGSSCQPDSFTDTETEYSAAPPNTSYSRISAETNMSGSEAVWQSVIDNESRFNRSCSSNDGLDSTTSIQPQLTAEEQLACAAGRQVAIHQLLTCEEDFTRMMKRGAQRFSRPLRHQLLSRSQHALLFQNIEKLLALSEFHICQMINKSYCAEDSYVSVTDGIIADMAGQIYETKISMLCEAYQMYYQGLDEALHLLQNLRQRTTFNKFLQEREKLRGYELNLCEFLEQPLSHFHQVVGCLGRVLLTTPPEHADYVHIKHVMKIVYEAVTHPTDTADSSHSETNSVYQNSAVFSHCSVTSNKKHQSMLKSCDSGLSSSSSSSSMDSEMLELQQKLSFSSHVKPFQLASANRHVILSGDLMYISDSSVKSCQVVLCSDLLLLTQKETKGQLKVIEEPVLLQQIVQADFDCVHADEFRILFQKNTSIHPGVSCDWTVFEHKFRATNMEQKWAWKTILGQRIKNVRSKTDSAYVSMEEFV